MKKAFLALVALCLLLAPTFVRAEEAIKPIRVGIIGLDTSHCTAFTKILNDPKNIGDLANMKVVAAFPGGSADIETSGSRVEKYTAEVKALAGVAA